jgi:hypothetical protein
VVPLLRRGSNKAGRCQTQLGFRCFLKHADKKSKHDCFSFLQRNMRLLDVADASKSVLSAQLRHFDVFWQQALSKSGRH